MSWQKFLKTFSPDFGLSFGLDLQWLPKDLDNIIDNFAPGKPQEATYFGCARDWWNYRNDENVLLLHYSDMKRDQRAGVKKIAEFVGVSLTEEELDRVNEKCGISHMKSISERFTVRTYGSPTADTVLCDPRACEGALIRTGQLNEGEAHLTGEQISRWQKYEEAAFQDPALRKWAANGGSYV